MASLLRLIVPSAEAANGIQITRTTTSTDGDSADVKAVFQAQHSVPLVGLIAAGESLSLTQLLAKLSAVEHPWTVALLRVLQNTALPEVQRRVNLGVEFFGVADAENAPEHPWQVKMLADVMMQSNDKALTEPHFTTLDAEGVAHEIAKASKILVMTGAGISVAAGIPDFRTPGIGLYDNLAKYDLPEPADLFTLDYLEEKPQVFYTAANEMKLWPGSFAPTHVHHFLKVLETQGKLLRCYTQNIDGMERLAGLNPELLVEAHGTFSAAHCIKCSREMAIDVVKAHVDRMEVPYCPECNGIVKPDVVFFGEQLPVRFGELLNEDLPKVDLLLVIGTSLVVRPFASIHSLVSANVPRVLINMEAAGEFKLAPASTRGRDFTRDVFLKGDCQAAVKQLAEMLGWGSQLDAAYKLGQVEFESSKPASTNTKL